MTWRSTFSTGIDVRLSLQPAADKASMTCSRLAIYLSTYLSSLPSIHPCINLSFTLDSLSLSLSRPLVAMRSSLPTIHAIMWCFWPYSAICPSISSCNPQVSYVSIYLARYLPMGLHTPCRLLLLETTAFDLAFGCFRGYPSIRISIYLSIFLSFFLSFLPSFLPSFFLSFFLSFFFFFLSFFLSFLLSFFLSFFLSVYPSIYLSICLSVCLSVCLSICLSVYLSICPSVYLPIYMSNLI